MTEKYGSKGVYNQLIAYIAEKLHSLGYRRRGNNLRKLVGGNAAIIEFQRSPKSCAEEVQFTVNIGVICGQLLEEWQPPIERAGATDAHLRLRIGALLPNRPDKWWDIGLDTDVETLCAELATLISTAAVPYLEQHLDTVALRALWATGKAPGLTEKQRLRFLDRLASLQSSSRFGNISG